MNTKANIQTLLIAIGGAMLGFSVVGTVLMAQGGVC
jgi:hypothetical protein